MLKEKDLRKEFYNRIKTLKLNEVAKEQLFNKFLKCYNDGFKCLYCKRRMELNFMNELSFSFDHTIPQSKGGTDEINNLEIICIQCNEMKGDKQPDWFFRNVKGLIIRKRIKEEKKAIRAATKDEKLRKSYIDVFQHLQAKKEREG